ncbi:glycosyltransferase [Georgenia sp. Z1344]|uniref:glycosyltransferase n=1 Tax=Georgenia sp. Z1344 TaxID=3416706 RepID=UPI003CF0D51A
MRIVVCPHDMGMGGSQINALDLAAAVRDRGHEVVVYAPPGPLVERARAAGLDWRPAATGLRLSLPWALGLMRLVREWRADLVHAYEWAPSMGASLGAHGWLDTPLVMTVLSMEVPGFLPRHLDLVVGTERLAAEAAGEGFAHRHVLEPPIDTALDTPRPAGPARRSLGLDEGGPVVSVVGRLTTDLDKSAGVIAAIAAVGTLAERLPVTLLVAGDGDDAARVRIAADEVNDRHGRPVVRMPGTLLDPGAAYAAGDVVLGMGSSILRGMAHARPAVVLGAGGYVRAVRADTMPEFLREGFFGHGDGGPYALRDPLEQLLTDRAERTRLGEWSRRLVEQRFGLDRAATVLLDIYAQAHDRSRGGRPVLTTARRAASLARSAGAMSGFLLHRAGARRGPRTTAAA